MPLKSRKNQYIGVNAHLHSVMQNIYAGWEEFHGAHITHVAEAIDRILPERYLAKPQRSFQITTNAAEERAAIPIQIAKPDVAIYERNPYASGESGVAEATTPTLTLRTIEVFDDPEDYLSAIAIESKDNIGQAVAWIEIISPSNKPPNAGYEEYNEKRLAALWNGIVMVEMDYLHETRPVIRRLPKYPGKEAFPYYITVTNPRPVYREGYVDVFGFSVDQAIPKVIIPLLGKDHILVDFGQIYNHTFESLRTFSEAVDYEQEPPRFNTYSAEDKQRILNRMAEFAKTSQQS